MYKIKRKTFTTTMAVDNETESGQAENQIKHVPFFWSRRFFVCVMGTIGAALLYSLRASLSVAIVAMVKQNATMRIQNGSCGISENILDVEYAKRGNLEWSESLQGTVLGATFYSYLVTPIFAARATEMTRWGPKWVTACGVSIPAIFHALTPVSATDSAIVVIIYRIIIGAFHGFIYSSLFAVYARWFPRHERSVPAALLACGGNLGLFISYPLSGELCKWPGWDWAFYVTALLHVPWVLVWIFFVPNSPNEDSRISQEELAYITQHSDTGASPKSSAKAPWLTILISKTVWASIIAKLTASFGYYLLLTKMPSYLDSVFGIPIQQNGLFNSFIYLASGVSMVIGGPLSSLILSKTEISLTKVRKSFETIALMGPAICILLVPLSGCNSNLVITWLVLAMFFYGFITGGEWPIIGEFAPLYSGTVFGLANTPAMGMGFVAPLIVGALLDKDVSTFDKNSLIHTCKS